MAMLFGYPKVTKPRLDLDVIRKGIRAGDMKNQLHYSINSISGTMSTATVFEDSDVEELFAERSLPVAYPQLNSAALAAHSFLNWYLTGKGGNNLVNNWTTVVLGTYLPACDAHLLKGCFHSSGKVVFNPPGNVGDLDLSEYRFKGQGASSADSQTLSMDGAQDNLQINKTNIAEWYKRIVQQLESTDAQTKQRATSYVGFIALVMLRGCVKDENNVTKQLAFQGENKFLKAYKYSIAAHPMPPPHEDAVYYFNQEFRRGQEASKKAITLVLVGYKNQMISANTEATGILKSACLHVMEYNGLGVVHWLLKISSKISLLAGTFLEMFRCELTEQMMVELQYIFVRQAEKDGGFLLWGWSRLLDDRYFPNLATKPNTWFIGVLIGLLTDLDSKSDVWNYPVIDANLKRDQWVMCSIQWARQFQIIMLKRQANDSGSSDMQEATRLYLAEMEKMAHGIVPSGIPQVRANAPQPPAKIDHRVFSLPSRTPVLCDTPVRSQDCEQLPSDLEAQIALAQQRSTVPEDVTDMF